MKLRLTNFSDFGEQITEKDTAIIKESGDGFELETTVGGYTETYASKTENSCKSHFTRSYGKGAKWEEVKEDDEQKDLFSGAEEKKAEEPQAEKEVPRGRPKKEEKKKTSVKKEAPEKKEEPKKEETYPHAIAMDADGYKDKEEVGTFEVEEETVGGFDVEEKPDADFDLSSYKTEPSEVEKAANDIKKSREGKKEVVKTIAPVETKDPSGMTVFKTQADAMMNVSKAIVVVESDTENQAARDAAKNLNNLKKDIDARRKELNKPLDLNIKSNNAQAKAIVDPIDKELDRMKTVIGKYETKKENERQAALAAAEQQKKEQEQLQAAETARVNRIKGSIDKMKTDLNEKVEKARKSATLLQYKKQLTDWKPSKENYMEFIDEVTEVVENIKNRIEIRLPIIIELEEAQEAGNTLKIAEISELLGEVKAEEKVKEEVKAEATETEDFQARQQLITLFTQIGVDNVANEVENIIRVYGNAQNAVANQDKIIESFQATVAAQETIEENKKSGLKNQRIDFEFEIIDKSKIPLEYLKVDDVAIRAAIKANRAKLLAEDDDFTISGVEIKQKTTTVLR